MVPTKRTSHLPLICQICGGKARGINFRVMSCMSCKAFFRRHALQPVTNALRCQRENNCPITIETRSTCSACRLKKCFSFDMDPKLIRRSTVQNRQQVIRKRIRMLPQPLPFRVFQKDSSLLTSTEWDLLSNIIHAYDQANTIQHSRNMLEQQAALLPKLRSKSNITLDIIASFYSTMQNLIERLPHFRDLSIDARRTLIQHNSDTTGAYNSIFVLREIKGLESSSYAVGCRNIYGSVNFEELKRFIAKLEVNGTLVKIMFLVLSFAENCSIVAPNAAENFTTMASAISLIRIQNHFVVILWKYLNYLYGFPEAVKCLNSLIKFILNILRWTSETPVAQHSDMVDTIVENTARALTD